MFPPCFLPPPKKKDPRFDMSQIVARLLPLMASVLAAQSGVTPFFRQDFQVPKNFRDPEAYTRLFWEDGLEQVSCESTSKLHPGAIALGSFLIEAPNTGHFFASNVLQVGRGS